MIKQILAISTMNLRNIPQRLGPSGVIVVGIAGVVAVLVALLAMAQGFESTLKQAGQPDRVLIMRKGSTLELNGNIPFDQAAIIEHLPGIHRSGKAADLAGETFVTITQQRREDGNPSSLPFRGIGPQSFVVRPEVNIVAGRQLEFGHFELMVGKGAAAEFDGLDIGDTISVHGAQWEVVGHFESGGDGHESEVWGDVNLVNATFWRGNTYSSLTLRLESADAFDTLVTAIEADRRLVASAQHEIEYYAAQSRNTTQLIRTVGVVISTIMAIGAIFAALNTMYAAVSSRAVEIATLRALGFGPFPVVTSVMVEALMLALTGGILGAAIAWFAFNGFTASTMGGTYTQVSFAFDVTPQLLGAGIGLAALLGIIGGLLPSIHAARVPVTVALRG